MNRTFTVFLMCAGTAGLEPVTSAVTGQRSNRFSYVPVASAILTDFSEKEKVRVTRGVKFVGSFSGLFMIQYCYE